MKGTLAQRVVDPLTLRLLPVRSNQLSFENIEVAAALLYNSVAVLTELRLRQVPSVAHIQISVEDHILLSSAWAQLPFVVAASLDMSVCHAAEIRWIDHALKPLRETDTARRTTPPSTNVWYRTATPIRAERFKDQRF